MFPRSSDGKESDCNVGDPSSIPGSGRSPGEGNGNPLQYSCLGNPIDGGAWWATVQFSSVQSLSHVRLFATPWTAACQASLSITNSRSSCRLTAIESVMPSNHLLFCHPLLLLPSIFPSIRVFSNESALCIRWPKDWSFTFSIIPSNEHLGNPLDWTGWISVRMDWLDLLAVQGTLNSLLQHHSSKVTILQGANGQMW